MGILRTTLTTLAAILTIAAGCASGGGVNEKTGDSQHTGTTGSTTSSSGAGGKAETCVPGQQIACACPGGLQGVQVCEADGFHYGMCTGCGTASGTGGASSSSGMTSTTSASSSSSTGASSSSSSSGSGSTTASSSSSTTASSSSSTGASSSSTTGSGGPPCPGGPTEIDLHQVTLFSNPPDLADWPVTTTLTEVDFTNDGVHLAFSKLDGPNRWPDVVPPGWDGPLQYTIGMAECIGGQWYASAVIEVWYGLPAAGGNVALDNQVATNWYYDTGRWGALAGRQPATGEIVGIFVAAGNLRNITSDDAAQSPVMERSNVVLVPMPDVNGATHSF